MDDIKHDPNPHLTRLRNMARQENIFEWDVATLNEAADEIERLSESLHNALRLLAARKKTKMTDDITDGFGSYWSKCDLADCDLHVVRPGDARCDASFCKLGREWMSDKEARRE